MPPEVLCTLPPIADLNGRFDMGASPWILTHISAGWRAISLATPSLWSRIVIVYSANQSTTAHSLALAQAQIERCRKLDIHFYGYSGRDSGPQIQMFELLAQHSLHWEELSLGVTAKMIPTLATLRDRIPSLRRLWIEWIDPATSAMSIDCFQTASSLVDASIIDDHHFVPVSLPIHQLTHCQLDAPWEEHRSLLTRAPNLIQARIDIISGPPLIDPPVEIINMPHLRRLYVWWAGVFPHFKLPSLEEVAFYVQKVEPKALEILTSLVDRSACPLRRLCLSGFVNKDTTLQLLNGLSSIIELVIIVDGAHSRVEVDALISTLTVSEISEGTNMVAPQLRCLLFGCRNTNYFDYTAYLGMLTSRWNAEGSALQKAALLVQSESVGTGPNLGTLRGLNALRRLGLDLLLLRGREALDEMNGWTHISDWNS
ncbi:hypothetical protein DFH06DRAFT_1295952 [Mycena polygramma]|nr:hypothetical protein DFH06DRAFT_1295952 [Mycena polygramma]